MNIKEIGENIKTFVMKEKTQREKEMIVAGFALFISFVAIVVITMMSKESFPEGKIGRLLVGFGVTAVIARIWLTVRMAQGLKDKELQKRLLKNVITNLVLCTIWIALGGANLSGKLNTHQVGIGLNVVAILTAIAPIAMYFVKKMRHKEEVVEQDEEVQEQSYNSTPSLERRQQSHTPQDSSDQDLFTEESMRHSDKKDHRKYKKQCKQQGKKELHWL